MLMVTTGDKRGLVLFSCWLCLELKAHPRTWTRFESEGAP